MTDAELVAIEASTAELLAEFKHASPESSAEKALQAIGRINQGLVAEVRRLREALLRKES